MINENPIQNKTIVTDLIFYCVIVGINIWAPINFHNWALICEIQAFRNIHNSFGGNQPINTGEKRLRVDIFRMILLDTKRNNGLISTKIKHSKISLEWDIETFTNSPWLTVSNSTIVYIILLPSKSHGIDMWGGRITFFVIFLHVLQISDKNHWILILESIVEQFQLLLELLRNRPITLFTLGVHIDPIFSGKGITSIVIFPKDWIFFPAHEEIPPNLFLTPFVTLLALPLLGCIEKWVPQPKCSQFDITAKYSTSLWYF